MTTRTGVPAPPRAAAHRVSAAALALCSLVLAAVPRGAGAQPADLDKLIPADALVYVALDGLQPFETAVTEFLDGVMPGQGGAMAGMIFMQMQSQPGMGEIERTKPVSFSFLASEKWLFALPLAKPADFEALLKTQPGTESLTVLAGQGVSLVSNGPIDLEALKKGQSPKTPLLQGAMRGFVDLPRLFEKFGSRIDETMGMISAMSGGAGGDRAASMLQQLRSSASRVDFAMTPSKAGLELAFTGAPSGDGLLATLAKSSARPGPELAKYLAALPEDCAMAGAMAMSIGGWKTYFAMSGGSSDGLAKLGAWLDKFQPLLTNQHAIGLAPSPAGGATFVQVIGSTDSQRFRALLNESAKDGSLATTLTAVSSPGATATCEMKPGADAIAGVPYDEVKLTIVPSPTAAGDDKMAAEAMAKAFAQPMLFAYPPGAVVSAMGPDGKARLERALQALEKGGSLGAAARAVPPNHSVAFAMNLGGLIKAFSSSMPGGLGGAAAMLGNLPAGSEHITLTMSPVGGSAETRLNLTAGALREISQAMMGGGMGPR